MKQVIYFLLFNIMLLSNTWMVECKLSFRTLMLMNNIEHLKCATECRLETLECTLECRQEVPYYQRLEYLSCKVECQKEHVMCMEECNQETEQNRRNLIEFFFTKRRRNSY